MSLAGSTVKDVLISCKDSIYHFSFQADLTELKSKLYYRLAAKPKSAASIVLLHGPAEARITLTVAAYRRICQEATGGVLNLQAIIPQEDINRVRGYSSSAHSCDSHLSSSPRSERSILFTENGTVYNKLLSTFAETESISQVKICSVDNLQLANFRKLGRSMALRSLTLDRVAGNTEFWKAAIQVVKASSSLKEMRLLAPCVPPEKATELIQTFLSKPTAQILSVRKATVLMGKTIDSPGRGLTEVRLVSGAMRPETLGSLAPVLKASKAHLLVLDLSRNGLGSIQDLASCLNDLIRLQDLNLADNSLGLQGMARLRSPLSKMRDLKHLNLAINYITEQGVIILHQSLRATGLETLDLSWEAAAWGFGRLEQTLQSVKVLRLRGNRLAFEEMERLLAVFKTMIAVEEIDFAFCGIENAGFNLLLQLPPLPTLKTLDLSGNSISPLNLTATSLSQCFPSLTSLRLSHLSPSPVSFLSETLPSLLSEIDFSHSYIGPETNLLDRISEMETLEKINLSECGLGSFKSDIDTPISSKIIHLDLSFNDLGSDPRFSFPILIPRNSYLQVLNLSGNGLSSFSVKSAFFGLQNAVFLEKLDMSYNCMKSSDFENFPYLPGLMSVDFSFNQMEAPFRALFQSLSFQKRLLKVNLAGNRLTFSFLNDFDSENFRFFLLKKLNLNHNPLGLAQRIQSANSTIGKMLEAFPRLVSLKLETTDLDWYIKTLISRLQHLPWLQTLSLSGNSLAHILEGREDSFPDLSGLKVLKIAGCLNPGEEINRILASFKSGNALETLDLARNDLGPDGVRRLSLILLNFPGLKHLNLSGNRLDILPAELETVLSTFTHLRVLDLSHNRLTSKQCHQLWRLAKVSEGEDGIRVFRNLRTLNISHNQISNQGGIYLSKFLSLTNIRTLDVSWNCISSPRLRLLQHCVTSLDDVIPPID